ncbi:DUF1810 domain-containing protein [Geomonas sp. RF6]|uniref:DUF1810 domain-containing protein n=1 Tax=Geomonas sp. RF6 TaxID=2897342 RepID=UPI001E625B81|nr:DUF1810 domain-containing protein [Geomonas sp. RF6]UFS70203.1 DUF1810 domain-containing protein [Geomonas sp. RF6]
MTVQDVGDDPHGLQRFVSAQDGIYSRALAELKNGQKRSHWMWFIFPQINGLGRSSMAIQYAIKSLDEARAYLAHPVLGKRLRECAEAVLAVQGRSASAIMGYPDDMKLKSSMTLFEVVADESDSVFAKVLEKYYGNERDTATLAILERQKGGRRD